MSRPRGGFGWYIRQLCICGAVASINKPSPCMSKPWPASDACWARITPTPCGRCTGWPGTLRNLGDLPGALQLFEQNLTVRRRVLGENDPDTLRSMFSVALTRRDLGDLPGALQLFEQTLSARRRVLGDDHPNTLWSMNNLAETRRALGDLQGAMRLHEQTP